jgi:thiamine biosynthesis lipoprotein ApbE
MSKNLVTAILFTMSLAFVYLTLDNIKNDKIKEYKEDNYILKVDEIKKYLKTLIAEKKNSTLAIALSLANNSNIIEALKQNNPKLVNLHLISLNLRENTQFKNVWFQLISKDGISLQRSWSDKRGDNIANKRLDLQQILKEPKVLSTISVGKFDMTFKAIVPIYDKNKKFLGIFETITHFNSIAKKLAKTGTQVVIVVDKRYTNQITKPFTNTFIDGHYVANLNPPKEILNHLEQEGVKNHIKEILLPGTNIIEEINYIPSYYTLNGIDDQPMGHFLLFHQLNSFDKSQIKTIKFSYNMYLFFTIIILAIFFSMFYTNDKDTDSSNYKQKVLIVLTILTLFVSFFLYKVLDYKIKADIKEYKYEIQKETLHQYDLIYEQNKKFANHVFSKHLNIPKVRKLFKQRKREELYLTLKKDYESLIKELDIRQLHFHLQDSTSFLRMHKPDKFGDSLKGIRLGVDYVNETKKRFDGFEEGKVFNGFRYIYPLFDEEQNHLGSVEVSFSAYAYMESFIKSFDKRANFLISKNVVDEKIFDTEKTNYMKSPVKGFYFDKEIILRLQKLNKDITPKRKSREKLDIVSTNIPKGKPFVVHFKRANELNTIIPLINKVSKKIEGSINITNSDKFIQDKEEEFYIFLTVTISILVFIIIALYKELISKHNYSQLSIKNQKILDSQRSIIIITDGKNIIESNQILLEFTNYKTLDAFKKEHSCICDFFEAESGKEYLQKKMGNQTWYKYIVANKQNNHKVKMKNHKKDTYIFKVEHTDYDKKLGLSIITFIDITHLENINITLETKINEALLENTKQLQMLQQQSKMAQMGEMIGAIAHQWRQPLNELGINIQKLKYSYMANQ